MKIVLVEFHQESNSFNPLPSGIEFFERSGMYEGEAVRAFYGDKPCALAGMLRAIDESGATAIPGCSMFASSGGPVEHGVAEHFLEKSRSIVMANGPVDGVFVSLHGATQTTSEEDCSGYILEAIRGAAGPSAIIAVSTDLHANITDRMMEHADIICGYRTYPHQDHYETGYRAAKLGLACLTDGVKPRMVKAKVPMIVPASGYSTMSGPFAELIRYGEALERSGKLADFSIYQMQPWLDVGDGASAVLAIDRDPKRAESYALELGQRLFDLRKSFRPDLLSVDDVIERAERNRSGKPVVLVDAADSSNAGATGDSVAVVRRLLARGSTLRTAIAVNDSPAADRAFALGVGRTADFTVGGSRYPEMNPPLQVEAYVKSLHDGVFVQEGPAGRGTVQRIGPSAVLQVGNISILVCRQTAGNGDPGLFRAFGIEPTLQELVVVKACGSYKAAYSRMTELIYDADTPGAAAVDLRSLPFRRLPKETYPLSELDGYRVHEIVHARRGR
ncbi:M81 family metallopeptidase [Paenibacillus antri]|uniref:M81 family metallopeptidase n=1 Tax=Paenibacillus antri TaxID=2582848 RepID=A0A5R9GEF7_9BACL|nr:M81 family metallopeptidase [Paenibacillus antri]TLS51594.1 M81 family metallopeptidase [Paenibacillus antri]